MKIKIKTQFITLSNLLKFASVTSSGAESKFLITEEMVLLNNEVCTMRGKKVYPGDVVEVLTQEKVKIEVL